MTELLKNRRPNVVGVGEVLWDLLPAGKQLGGAPANFVCHAQALGAAGSLITRVGNDALGRELTTRLQSFGLPLETIQVDPQVPTGTVTVTLSAGGQPTYIINQGAWDAIRPAEAALQAASQADAICFGSLAQRQSISCHTIQRLVAAAPATALRVFDINLRQNFYTRDIIEQSLQLADVFKLNDGELPVVAEMFGLSGTALDQLRALTRQFGLRLVALTRGAQGSLLVSPRQISDHPGLPGPVKDTVGAGDSFTAALVMGLLRNIDLGEINQRANKLATYVCSQDGAVPPLPSNLQSSFAKEV